MNQRIVRLAYQGELIEAHIKASTQKNAVRQLKRHNKNLRHLHVVTSAEYQRMIQEQKTNIY